jgi:hypothetical protein
VKRAPVPPRPDLVRRPQAPFGWLEAHLLHEHWLSRLQPDAIAVLLLLALAADRRGASYYSRGRMADCIGIDVERVDQALQKLLAAGLVELRPWRPGSRDGVWQILPIERCTSTRAGKTMSVADLLRSLGIMPQPAPGAPGSM